MKQIIAVLLVFLTPFSALAWSECGHHIIAIMAFDKLNENQKQEIMRLLKSHPRFEEDFKAPEGTNNRDYWLIGRAGYWPDVARRSSWDRPTWHYELGSTLTIGDVASVPPFPGPLPEGATLESQELHIAQAIELCRKVLADPSGTDADKALAICWVCHLVADSHQPCHAGSLYTESVFPDGDRGANSIKTKQSRNMHALWDGLLGQRYDAADIRRRIAEISGDPELITEGFRESVDLNPLAWLAESRQAATEFVYTPEVMEPISVAIRAKSSELTTIDLSADYLKRAGRLAQSRAMQAAIRLSRVLQELEVGETDPVIDGMFSEWTASDIVATDPVGDATDAFDLTEVAARMVGAKLFLRFDTGKDLNLQSGAATDGTLILSIGLPRDRTLTIDFRGRSALLRNADSASTIPWSDIGFMSLPTYAAKDFEMLVDLSSLGVRSGDELSVSFEGSDELSASVKLLANSEEVTKTVIATDRTDNALRVASINTLRSGLGDPRRSEVFEQMMKFADADIYCFNEESDEAKFRSAVGTRNVHWQQGCAIASSSELRPLSMDLPRAAAALVSVAGQKRLVVISVHLKCCGYAGSKEDLQRIDEVNALLAEIRRLRNGDFGPEAAEAPVVIIGDFNLVGSREPLDLILASGFKEQLLRSPIDGSAATWRGVAKTESFWPGRLDYVTYDAQRIESASGYFLNPLDLPKVFETATVETPVSDHAMLVVDFQLAL